MPSDSIKQYKKTNVYLWWNNSNRLFKNYRVPPKNEGELDLYPANFWKNSVTRDVSAEQPGAHFLPFSAVTLQSSDAFEHQETQSHHLITRRTEVGVKTLSAFQQVADAHIRRHGSNERRILTVFFKNAFSQFLSLSASYAHLLK